MIAPLCSLALDTENSKLRSLSGAAIELARTEIEELLEMLETRNFTIHELYNIELATDLQQDSAMQQKLKQIRFLVKLNKEGYRRGHLLSNQATPKDWVDVITEWREEVSVSFYYFSKNPGLLLS